jgi:tape measure domain-containing protein
VATETIVIDVRTRGLRDANRDFGQLNRQVQGVDRTAQLLRRALAGLSAAFAVRQFVGFADQFQNIQNRLGTVTKSSAELRAVQDLLFKSANQTRQSYGAVVELYARSDPVLRNLGRSQAEVIKFVEQFNKAVASSGATSIEAENATRQFLQGLGKGRLDGEELNSVLEQLPIVADLIAAKLGVTRLALKELGSQGIITPKVIIEAFEEAEGFIDSTFAKIIPTVAAEFVVLRNNAIQFFGVFSQSSGISAALSTSLRFLSENFGVVVSSVLTLVQTIVTLLIGRAILGAIAAVGRFVVSLVTLQGALALLSGGTTLIITAVVGIASALVQFGSFIKIGEGLATVNDFLVAGFLRIASAIQEVLLPLFGRLGVVITTFLESIGLLARSGGMEFGDEFESGIQEGFGGGLREVLLGVAKILDGLVNIGKIGGELLFIALTAPLKGIFNILVGFQRSLATVLNPVAGFLESAGGLIGIDFKIERIDTSDFLDLTPIQDIQDVFKNTAGTGIQDFVAATLADAEKRAGARAIRQGEADIANQRAVQGLQAERQGAPVVSKAARQAQEEAQKRQDEVLKSIRGPEIERQQRIRDLNSLLLQGRITQDEFNFAIQRSQAPLQQTLIDFDREIELLKLSEQEYNKRIELQRIQDDVGRNLTLTEQTAIASRLAEIESLQNQNQLLNDIRGPQTEYITQTAALDDLMARVGLSASEYNTALENIRLNYLATQTDAGSGFEAGLIRIKQQFTDLSGLAENTLVSAFQGAEDALVEFATTGQLNFKGLVDSILADVARLAIRQSITGPLAGLLGNVGKSSSGGGLFGGILGAAGGIFGGLFGGSSAGASGGGQFFQGGADFIIGSGNRVRSGADSQLVSFFGQPGERVRVTPRGQGSESMIVVNYNITTNDADSFQRSQPQILSRTQSSLDRASRRLNRG